MEQQQRSLIFTAIVGLIILSIIVGSIYYLVKFIQARVASSRQTAAINQTVNPSESPLATASAYFFAPQGSNQPAQTKNLPNTAQTPANTKSYNGGQYQLHYPQNWGLLTCTNSANLELDPEHGVDAKVACGTAVKPVTILVNDIAGCSGDNLKIGSIDVMKSKKTQGDYIAYQWCTKTDPVLNITHRVSKNGGQATSINDYSQLIEQMISSISLTRGS